MALLDVAEETVGVHPLKYTSVNDDDEDDDNDDDDDDDNDKVIEIFVNDARAQ